MNLECSSADKKTENGTNASPEHSSSISQDDTKNWGSFPDKESNQQGKGSVPRSPKSRDLPTVSARPRNHRPLIPPKPHVLHCGTCGTEAKQPSQPLDSQLQRQEGFHKKTEMTGNTNHKPPKPSKPQPPPKPQHICTSGAHTVTTITLEKEKNEKTTTRSYVKWQIHFFEEKQRSLNEPSKRSTQLPAEIKQSPSPKQRSHAHTETTTTLEREHSEKTPYISQQGQLYEGRQKQVAQSPEPPPKNFNPAEIKQSPTPQQRSHAHTETTTTLEREHSEKTPYVSQQGQLYEGRQKQVAQSPEPSQKNFNPAEIKQSPTPQQRSRAHTETTTTLEREHGEKTPYISQQRQLYEGRQKQVAQSPEPSPKTFNPAEIKQSPTPQQRSRAHTETTTTLEREHSEKTPYISQQGQLYEGRQKQVAQSPEPSPKNFNPAEIKQSPTPQQRSRAHTETTTTLEREHSEKTPYISQQRQLYEGRQKQVPRSPGPSRRSFNPAEIKQSPRPQHRSVRVHLPSLPIGSERRRFTFNSSSQSLLDTARQLSSNRKWCDQPEVCVLQLNLACLHIYLLLA